MNKTQKEKNKDLLKSNLSHIKGLDTSFTGTKATNVVTGIYGWKGGGKTLIMTLFLLMEWEQAMRPKIFSNYALALPFQYLQGKDMTTLNEKLGDSLIAIDELHEYADSRNSQSLQNRRVATFFLQSRHTNSNVYYTTQFKDQIDKRIRRITDIDIICENMHIDSDNDGDEDMFKVTINDHRGGTARVKTLELYGAGLFNLYDSTYRINPFVWENNKKKKTNRK